MTTLTDAQRAAILVAVHEYAVHTGEAGYWRGRGMPQAARACVAAATKHLDVILDTLLPEEPDDAAE